MKIIKPDEVEKQIPQKVLDAFNELIQKKWNGQSASFTLSEVSELAAKKLGTDTDYLFDNKFLDVEKLYEDAGWNVYYKQPAYNEDGISSFSFTKVAYSRGCKGAI